MNKTTLARLCVSLSLVGLFVVSCGTPARDFAHGPGSGGDGTVATSGGTSTAGDGGTGAGGTLPSAGAGAVSVGGDDADGGSGAGASGGQGMADCAATQKLCGGVCVDIDDPTYGCDPTLCTTTGCPDASGATLLCDAGQCLLGSCAAGTKKCDGRCVSLTDPATGCGAATCDAATCPSQGTGATVACEGSTCVIGACPTDYKNCGNKCVAISDPTYGCGATTCDASGCPPAGTGTLVCQNSACVIGTCGAGTKKCGSNCVTTDANNGCADATRCTACANNEACSGTPTTCQCVPTPMASVCAGKCGSVSNGCGGMYTCGTCTSPQSCGGAGTANVCGCTPTAMTTACSGKNCGSVSNGCGGTYVCGSCSGSTPNCVNNSCVCTPTPMSTACSAKSCGTVSDGCTGSYTCGTCGGSTPNCVNDKCVCTPTPMSTACSGKSCGTVSDGCTGSYTCGTCSGSTPNCVSNKCVCTPTPMSTACSGKSCGTVSDGCTGSYTCGTCNGTIPACKNGTSCVECTADSNCTPLGYKTCDQSQNSCVCAQESSGNRITNGGFDDSFLSGWGYDAMVVKWDSSDVDNCPRSGSVKIGSGSPNSGTLTQCVSVGNGGGKSFTLGFKYKQDTPSTVLCLVSFATDANCTTGAGPDFFSVQSGVGVSTTNWQSVSGSAAADPGTSYISIQCQTTNGGNLWLDQMYLTQGSGSF